MMTLLFENGGDMDATAKAWSEISRKSISARDELVKKYAWSIPDNAILNAIIAFADGKTIMDVGAGSGYWAKLLEEKGAKVIAIDDKSEEYTNYYFDVVKRDGVEYLKSEPAAKDACLFMSWTRKPFWQQFPGNKLIVIGEQLTLNDDPTKDGWRKEKVMDIPKWEFMHDHAAFYTRG